MPQLHATVASVIVSEVGVSSWTPVTATDFFKNSAYEGLAELASQQVESIPQIRLFEVEVSLDVGVSGRYGPIYESVAGAIQSIAPMYTGVELDATCIGSRSFYDRIASTNDALEIARGSLDCALWDAEATLSDRAVGELLGGNTNCDIPCYASLITTKVDGPLTEEIASTAASLGFWGQKWRLPEGPNEGRDGLMRNVRRIERIRRSCPFDHFVMVEADERWTPKYFMEFCIEAKGLGIAWVEEPFSAHHYNVLSRKCVNDLPIAAGERCRSFSELAGLIDSGIVAVVQPDAINCGGLSILAATRKLSHLRQQKFAPHGRTLVPALHASTLHADTDQALAEYNPILEPSRQRAMGIRIVPCRGSIRYAADQWLGLWPRDPS